MQQWHMRWLDVGGWRCANVTSIRSASTRQGPRAEQRCGLWPCVPASHTPRAWRRPAHRTRQTTLSPRQAGHATALPHGSARQRSQFLLPLRFFFLPRRGPRPCPLSSPSPPCLSHPIIVVSLPQSKKGPGSTEPSNRRIAPLALSVSLILTSIRASFGKVRLVFPPSPCLLVSRPRRRMLCG